MRFALMSSRIKQIAFAATAMSLVVSSISTTCMAAPEKPRPQPARPQFAARPAKMNQACGRPNYLKQDLGRDARFNQSINKDLGHLDGHYQQLENRDQAIEFQARREARQNGGFLTNQQQAQINREENQLGQQINTDYRLGPPPKGKPLPASVAQAQNRYVELNEQTNSDLGHLNGQYWKVENRDQAIGRQIAQDRRGDNGNLTAQEQSQINREENQLQSQINRDYSMASPAGSFARQHPARAQVLNRDNQLNNELNADYGHLNGNFGKLEHKDWQIQQQEQADARKNGGFITGKQETQLENEETGLQSQINNDLSPTK